MEHLIMMKTSVTVTLIGFWLFSDHAMMEKII